MFAFESSMCLSHLVQFCCGGWGKETRRKLSKKGDKIGAPVRQLLFGPTRLSIRIRTDNLPAAIALDKWHG
ncbi:hypothetical protein BHK69_12825 [Bosea vaviloviae]|uniref:Uncharacterized protein n=1 Tax=Bosea vaviloviae TaxID=1526658 RepID=A0A1D7U1K5_9HYPH|nr:hypothetical protein BHK69_12825 [Bosea vaviloviae]